MTAKDGNYKQLQQLHESIPLEIANQTRSQASVRQLAQQLSNQAHYNIPATMTY
jgi:hypothetical protein